MIELIIQIISSIVLSSVVTSLVLYCIKKLFNIEERLSRIEAYVNDVRTFIFNHLTYILHVLEKNPNGPKRNNDASKRSV